MKQKKFFPILVTLIWLSALIAQPVSATIQPTDLTTDVKSPAAHSLSARLAQQPTQLTTGNQIQELNQLELSPDADGDGIPNDAEQAGWYNNRGGPYLTDPLDPDSDDDGLTDGEEQLFNTFPNNSAMPGIYALYNDAMQTKQYYPWGQYGDEYISYRYNTANPDVHLLPRVIARRGTNFELGGSVNHPDNNVTVESIGVSKDTNKISISGPDPCTGRWSISIESDAQVGTYKLTLQANDDTVWTDREIFLFVVFELPDDMTGTEIATFVYDDDPSDLRDETALWIDTAQWCDETTWQPWSNPGGNQNCWGDDNYYAYSYALRFDNQQFEQWFFEGDQWYNDTLDRIIYYIDGLDDQWDAAIALRQAVDDDTIFGHPRPLFNSWDVLHPGADTRNQCSNVAALLAAYCRAAGVPSRPIMTDWQNYTFDHATEYWLHGAIGTLPGDWYVNRGYSPHIGGVPQERSDWGYGPWYSPGHGTSDMVVVGGDDWVWAQTSGSGDPHTFDHIYHAMEPPPHEIIANDWWQTVATAYWDNSWLTGWGWGSPPTEPVVTSAPPFLFGDAATPADDVQSVEQGIIQGEQVQLDRPNADYTIDQDGDNLYDQLVIEIPVSVNQAGNYWFYASLGTIQNVQLTGTGGEIASTAAKVYLEPGSHNVQIPFEGLYLFEQGVDGPYYLSHLWVTDFETSDRLAVMNQALASIDATPNFYSTSAYMHTDFETPQAQLSDHYSDYSFGRSDKTLNIDVGLNIYQSGQYTVLGDLYDADGEFLGQASWTGSNSFATLNFAGLTGANTPYTLKFVQLFDAAGNLIDSNYRAYTADVQGAIQVAAPSDHNHIMGDGITPTAVYADSPIDLNSNSLYDLLNIDVQVEVSQAGSYRLEGWLVDEHNTLIAYSLGEADILATGIQTLTLSFDGRLLSGQGNQAYNLVALKVLEGIDYVVRDEVEIAYTTAEYDRSTFEPKSDAMPALADDMENGTDQWLAQAPWALTDQNYHSPLHAWTDSPAGDYGNNVDTSLSTANSMDISSLSEPILYFQTCHALETDDQGFVQVSTNGGGDWTTIATYSGDTPTWLAEFVDLSAYQGAASLDVRFRLQSNASGADDGWYIDDVYLVGWAGPTSASFTHDPEPALVDETVTFVADYTPAGAPPPITYTWDFDDGSPLLETSIATITHQYNNGGAYDALLTVANPYGSANYSDTVHVAQPVLSTSFVYTPTEPAAFETIYFTATYTPLNATPPITYVWNFGDGPTAPSSSPYANYPGFGPGPHTVWLTTSNQFGWAVYSADVGVGCTALVSINFDYDPSEPNVGQTVNFTANYDPSAAGPITFTWDFGDGEGDVIFDDPTVSHTYAQGADYVVTLRGDTAACGGLNATPQTITIHQAVLTASFGYEPADPLVDQDITFVASYGPATAHQPVAYTWDFGDGPPQITGVPTITHSFALADSHAVSLTVSNIDGSADYQDDVMVAQPLEEVYFEYAPEEPEAHQPVTFTAHHLPGDTTLPITYTWDFGDDSPPQVTNDAEIVHSFIGGNYTVQLHATNGYGEDTFQDNLIIPVGVETVSFSYTLPITYGILTTLVADYGPPTATHPIYYTWDFGDGLTETVSVPTVTHAFLQVGDLTVQLTANNGYGSAYYEDVIPVNGHPVETAWFSVDTVPVVAYEQTNFIGYSGPSMATPPVHLVWNFGDGPTTPTTGGLAYYTFTQTGLHTVWLTATNDYGQPASYSGDVQVLPHQPGWDKLIWHNDDGPYGPSHTFDNLLVGDTIVIADWVSYTYTSDHITFTLTEEWQAAFDLTEVITQGGGSLSQEQDTITWQLANANPNTWYAITKTFEVDNADWEETFITETLWSDDAIPQPAQIIPRFYYSGTCVPVDDMSFAYTPANPETDQTINFTASAIYGHEPISYTWDFGDGSSDSGAAISHAYTMSNTYTVVLTGSNCGGAEQDVFTDTITVISPTAACTEVESVALSIENVGTIYTNTVVTFSVAITPNNLTTPYNYRITIDDVPGDALSASDATLVFTHTFENTGTHNVSIAVWNCEMQEADAITGAAEPFQVYEPGVCIDITSVQLTLLTTGTIYAGGLVEFSANIAPNGFTPSYTYTIDYDDGSTPVSGSSNNDPFAFTYTFTETGTYNVVFAALNCTMTEPVASTPLRVIVNPSTSEYDIYLPIVIKNN